MSKKHDPMRDPLKKVRVLASAKEGVQHWRVQRVTAIALVPLVLVMLVTVLKLAPADHATVVASFRHPLLAIVARLTVLAVFWHRIGSRACMAKVGSICWVRGG